MGSSLFKKDRQSINPPTKNGQEVTYRTHRIKRRKKDEYHVFMGFDSLEEAMDWIDWGIKDNFLTKPAGGLTPGEPKRNK